MAKRESLQYEHNGDKRIRITDYGIKAEAIKYGGDSVYGSIIANDLNKEHIWKIKCVKGFQHAACTCAVGLTDATHQSYGTYFYANDNSYAYKADGGIRNNKINIQNKTSGFKQGDELTILYSPSSKVLSLSINDEYQEDADIEIPDNPNGYKLAIYLYNMGDKIHLTSELQIDNEKEMLELRQLPQIHKYICMNLAQ